MSETVRCGNCERNEFVNDALRDRCGTLELINEGLRERALLALNCDPNVDLNGRVAVLQLDRAVRRIAELEEKNQHLLDTVEAIGVKGLGLPDVDAPGAEAEWSRVDLMSTAVASMRARIAELEAALAEAPGPHCPQCDAPVIVKELPVTVDPSTGYRDGGEFFDCTRCGERDMVRALETESDPEARRRAA